MTLTVTTAAPDPAEVSRICAISNRVIRNLEITECYARLSAAFRGRTGSSASWCTFATWASRQAGGTIRGEDLLDNLKRRLGRKARLLSPIRSIGRTLIRKGLFEPDTRLGRAVAAIHTPFDALERASEAVALGNLKVFTEIGAEFARFLQTVPPEAAVDSPELDQFLTGLRPGDPPDGQDYLRQAFTHYQASARESDPGRRAALVLLANLQIGFHEQTRLQPQIAQAVDAPAITAGDLGRRVLHGLFPTSRRWPGVLHGPAATALGLLASGIRTESIRVTREVVTESMMVLALPGSMLALGRNLAAPVPHVLIGNPCEELAAFIAVHDPCAPGESRCGATDWCDLRQRMHYIVHLFRAFAESAPLFTPPFTDQQVERFRAGVVPRGRL